MAIYNEILVGRYARFLQKLFGIKGGVPAKQLAGEVMAVFNLFSGVENRYLEMWDRYGAQALQTAVAAQNSVVNIRNPSTSNTIAVIEKLAVTIGVTLVAANYFNGVVADLANPATSRRLDSRSTRNASGLIVTSANNIATLPAGNQFGLSQQGLGITYDAIIEENMEIPMLPGDGIQISAGNNAQLNVWVIWRERFLEDSERA